MLQFVFSGYPSCREQQGHLINKSNGNCFRGQSSGVWNGSPNILLLHCYGRRKFFSGHFQEYDKMQSANSATFEYQEFKTETANRPPIVAGIPAKCAKLLAGVLAGQKRQCPFEVTPKSWTS